MITKNSMIRYRTLDRCFRNTGRMYFWQDLVDACNEQLLEYDSNGSGISRRTLFMDISFMESEQGWSVPLERMKFGRKTFYRYSDTNFSISNEKLNEGEMELIQSALHSISMFSGTPQLEMLNEMIPLLESKFGYKAAKKEVISYEMNEFLKGKQFLQPIFQAIHNQRVLQITYQPFGNGESIEFHFHPSYLKQYNNRWFAFGYNSEETIFNWNVPLDRIVAIQETDNSYKNSDIDWHEYFDDMIGVTKPMGKSITEVKLKFSEKQLPYIETKPLHSSQRIKISEDGIVTIQVIPNYELEKLILSFGETVEVIEPKELRLRMEERLENAKENYS